MDIKPMAVVPTKQQIRYQRTELIGFIHFTVNTFTDKEWGDGTESPAIFNPSELDARQWAQAAKDAGNVAAGYNQVYFTLAGMCVLGIILVVILRRPEHT